MSDKDTSEEAVRSYLLWLEDPTKLRDQQAIDEATKALSSEHDPIARLKVITKLESLEAVDGETYRRGFLKHAKTWARAHGVSASAFGRLGVPPKDLRDAGLAGTAASAANPRSRRVSPDAVQASVPQKGAFNIREIEERSGASNATVRKVVLEMVRQGAVVDLGPDPAHSGRGRAPATYRRAKAK